MASGRLKLSRPRCFVAVTETVNLRGAADRLDMTQPPVSRWLRPSKERLGRRLPEPETRQVRLTPAGEDFRDSPVDLLQRAERAAFSARQAERGEAEVVAMVFVPSAVLSFVPTIVVALAERPVGVGFRPTEMMSHEVLEAIRLGRIDLVGLTRLDRGSASRRVVSESFVLASPPRHPLARTDAPRPADLHGQPFVGYSSEREGALQAMHQSLLASEDIDPDIRHEMSQTHMIVAPVGRGWAAPGCQPPPGICGWRVRPCARSTRPHPSARTCSWSSGCAGRRCTGACARS